MLRFGLSLGCIYHSNKDAVEIYKDWLIDCLFFVCICLWLPAPTTDRERCPENIDWFIDWSIDCTGLGCICLWPPATTTDRGRCPENIGRRRRNLCSGQPGQFFRLEKFSFVQQNSFFFSILFFWKKTFPTLLK